MITLSNVLSLGGCLHTRSAAHLATASCVRGVVAWQLTRTVGFN